jgi:hypothetical protein
MKTELEILTHRLKQQRAAEKLAMDYSKKAADLAIPLILPFLQDRTKCTVELGVFDFHDAKPVDTKAWEHILKVFNAVGEKLIKFHHYEGGNQFCSLEREDSGSILKLYMDHEHLEKLKIPVDISQALAELDKREKQFRLRQEETREKILKLSVGYNSNPVLETL